MRRRFGLLTVLALLSGVPLSATAQEPTCPSPEEFMPPEISFSQPKYIDTAKAGGEPVSIIAQDGSINVSAHAGTTHIYKNPDAAGGAGDFVVGYANQTLNWRSEDGGNTWQYVGTMGAPAGPHSATSTGFSDPDFAMDQAGKIYNTEIDLANVAVFSSNDDGQSYAFATPEVSSGDRPWLAANEPDEVFLYINLPQQLWKSTNGGIVWTPVHLGSVPITSKPITDPLNEDDGLIGPQGMGTIAISADDGETWTEYDGAPLGNSEQFFGAVAADSAGNVYQAAAGGYNGSADVTANGQVTFASFNRATKQWNEKLVEIPTPEGDAMWPWITAGDENRVAVTWYQNLKGKPDEFYVYVAYTENAQGTWAECSDGSQVFIPPQFSVTNASGRPIHKGNICLAGTACNWQYGTNWD
ncbi:MAG TPA: hypothetical protein VEA19_01700, partial [Actinomycetota bacterium]|nr:hypothetical protein [Actinomycetota bacterium]